MCDSVDDDRPCKHVIVSKLIAALVLALGGLWAVRGYGVVGLATVSALVLAVENLHLCYVAKQKSGFGRFLNGH